MISGVTHGFVFPYGWWLGPSYTSSMAWSIVHWQAWPTIAYHLCSSMLGRVLLHFDSRKWKHMATTEAVFSKMSGGFWSLQFWRRTSIMNIDRHMYERSTEVPSVQSRMRNMTILLNLRFMTHTPSKIAWFLNQILHTRDIHYFFWKEIACFWAIFICTIVPSNLKWDHSSPPV